MILVFIILGWLIAGLIAYGLTLGHFTYKYPILYNKSNINEDIMFAVIMGIMGPIGLFVSIVSSDLKHFLLVPPTPAEKFAISLDKQEF